MNIRARASLLVTVALFLPQSLPAQTTSATQPATDASPGGFSLTIYSTADPATFDPQQLARERIMNAYSRWQNRLPGYGVVRERRAIELNEGDNTVRITDVASGIDPTTVAFQSLTAPAGATVLEQNYEYDVVSAEKLLEKYIGKDVTLWPKGDGPKLPIRGNLLSAAGGDIVVQSQDGGVEIVQRQEIERVALARHETGLITKPTLVWKVHSDKPGKHDAQVTYQTDGLTWRADYNVVVNKDDSAADLAAWVSILNESGASYPEATLKLVAGDVQRIKPEDDGNGGQSLFGGGGGGGQKVAGFKEKAFFEYHLYTLGRPTSLADNSTKQIELFEPKSNIPVTKTFVYYGLPASLRYRITPEPDQDRHLGTQSNKKVDIYLQIKNTEKNGLGIPLPAGRLRVYKVDDADGSKEFIGEDVITHTPKDEEVLVKLGQAFDLVGERKQTDFKSEYDERYIAESFEIKLRNHKTEPARVIVRENLFRWVNWEIIQSSDKHEKQDFRTIHLPVEIPPGGEKTVTYTVKYTW